MKKLLTVLLSGLLFIGLVGCSSNDEKPAGGDEEITVYFLTKILGNQYWSVVEEGARAAADELGVKLVVTGLANEAEVEKQVQQLQDAVSAQASAIVIGPVDSTAMANPVSDAFKSGIPIVAVDTMINTDDFSAALLTDNVAAGRDAAKSMIELLEEKGVSKDEVAQVAMQIGNSGSQTIIDRLAGFNEYWDANAPKTWEVLNKDVKVNDGDITKAVNFTQDFLTTYPNLKGVFGANNGSTVGFVTGLTEANRQDIAMVGFDFSPEMEKFIRTDGFTASTIVQKQYMMGYEGVKVAVELAKGNKPAEKVIDTGVLVVRKNNIDNPEVQEIINPTK
ncbi:substrate-binding domain-containing protein [Erysipelothrix sp. HDW6C]|uniref:ABC transporter substrate-binding protein n=1 Tax=Erysipelothrix sp. HDW6C TaxID=2714930 RepID=UPI00140A014F|nr:ABC transporter substrate-binding protein [Erysipelothrix sp. HDW6C]QIK69295.1 substrate-binding domain-containing protein [Erysipelothrix sp. HDW6C]